MRPIFKTKMLIYQSKASLDENIFFSNHSSFRTRNLENAGKIDAWEQGFHIPFLSIIYLLLKLKLYF